MAKIKKKVKSIKVDADKCSGCRSCEVICSAFHAIPRYSSVNPARSRVQVVRYPMKDIWIPVFAGEYAPAECMGREIYTIDKKEYKECDLCRAACPARDRFKEPDSGLPLRCDMCEDEPPLEKPKCVEWCLYDVLEYSEREEEVEESVEMEKVEAGLTAMVNQYGLQSVIDTVSRISKKD
ncbi:MAG: (4Fe-4S)-binding protein [Spirochaetota bacterium]